MNVLVFFSKGLADSMQTDIVLTTRRSQDLDHICLHWQSARIYAAQRATCRRRDAVDSGTGCCISPIQCW